MPCDCDQYARVDLWVGNTLCQRCPVCGETVVTRDMEPPAPTHMEPPAQRPEERPASVARRVFRFCKSWFVHADS